ncbi:hypothetical protein TWF106_009377 [Orbilia oligospora]|uniref:Insulin-induced protein n=1 Tax=Orbilia oligospora TaxID=2813651 RepID=A0A6G1MAI8_ORBOL|nr:hypothetical protein TWF788_006127 [Orbilia oligospora]KAF3207744.1 hypothetical protein TWF191_000943 [Orbilia oligospora]KAF3213718.1 hypothetical protein TWF106_009377 [Orbilia oligospora]KAF3218973.1 hypothetical protein TWF679_000384 [Orbilia oligospora]KAF3251406.1 hypothetical protein TWF192_004902 [Orbilia oligospora]
MTDSSPPIYKPTPRRGFILGDNFDPSPTDTPTNELLNPPTDATTTAANGSITPSGPLSKRSQSIRNLTTSALFGIYGPSAYDSVPGTPGATRQSSFANLLQSNGNASSVPTSPTELSGDDGSTLPSKRSRPLSNLSRHHSSRSTSSKNGGIIRQIGILTVLFSAGASYGFIISQLHDQSHIAPVKVQVERDTVGYLVSWGIAAMVLGSLLPWADGIWEDYVWESGSDEDDGKGGKDSSSGGEERGEVTPGWNPAVRSIGAFVGIAYAIRKLPWQSTSQASLTLASANPVLWYILDRTRTGFWLSTIVAVFGSMFLIGFNPDFVAIPSDDGVGIIEKLRNLAVTGHGGAELQMKFWGATTWIASVLYVSCLCFGNLGRRVWGRKRS